MVPRLLATLKERDEEIAGLKKDSERLEAVQKWMESGSFRLPQYDPTTFGPECKWAWHTQYHQKVHGSFREAIDDAMEGK